MKNALNSCVFYVYVWYELINYVATVLGSDIRTRKKRGRDSTCEEIAVGRE